MTKKKLFSVTLKDCKVETFTVGGHGGSGKDTSNTGVRISHVPSGAVGTASDTRSQLHNKRLAFRRMGQSKAFRAWVIVVAGELQTGKSIEQRVEEEMHPSKLKIEIRKDDKWICAPVD